MPAVILLVMSIFTNINLGLRYVLPALPFLFICGRTMGAWAGSSRAGSGRWDWR